MTTVTVDADDLAELTEILDYLVGSLATLIAPATIAPSADGDAYDLNDLRGAMAISPSGGRVVMTLDGTAVPTRWGGHC
jgi:hypothetical protein